MRFPGVGPKTVQKLLREFGSVANLKRVGIEKLAKVVSSKTAEKIVTHLETQPAPHNRLRNNYR